MDCKDCTGDNQHLSSFKMTCRSSSFFFFSLSLAMKNNKTDTCHKQH